MTAFIIRRLLWTIPVLLLVIFLTFVLMRQIEGNPFRRTSRAVPPAVQANLERKFNLDEPWYVQYALYVKGVFTFDLGPSLTQRDRTVNDIIKEHFPKSLELGLLAFAWATLIGIPMGVIAALRQNSAYDYGLMFLSNVGYAVPSFIITGTFVIEVIFSIPGIGRYFVQAVTSRDYSVVMGITVLTSVVIVIANLIVDILYGILDPRTRDARA